MQPLKTKVCIVGAGPVGLLTALRLGQAGIDTLVLEAHPTVLPATRAMVYMPVVIPVLTQLGIIDKVKQEAYLNRQGITWRDIDGHPLASLPLQDSTSGDFDGVLLLGQYKLATLILDELKKYPCVEVRLGLRCGGIEDLPDADYVKLLAWSRGLDQQDTIVHADYVLAADGANSTVRHLLTLPFEGFTYSDWKMIGTDVLYDFAGKQDFTPLNFVVHPEHWAVIAYTGQDEGGGPSGSGTPQYRVAYVEKPDLPDGPADYLARASQRLLLWTKGDTNFQVLRAEPYINSQRVASQAIKGRVMLAGDALHSNNPIGGLGLTGGILDAYCYGNAIVRVVKHGETPELLAKCANSRRQTWITATNALSQANIDRLYRADEATEVARAQFFHKLNSDATFPAKIRSSMDEMMGETFN